ncbi:hypothetical protein ACFJIX_28315 [Roseateles sp. UC29_93]|uniref:hypothetical protein n=1 Tax=Roseateles sp. UC29_93 TaxID=3350177 RepID=UPI00366DA604
MKSIRELHEKYGIPYFERTQIYPAKNLPGSGESSPAGEAKPDWQAIAERVIEKHRDVLRALAKR